MLFERFILAVVRIQCRRAREEIRSSKGTAVEVRHGGLAWAVGSIKNREIIEGTTDSTW